MILQKKKKSVGSRQIKPRKFECKNDEKTRKSHINVYMILDD